MDANASSSETQPLLHHADGTHQDVSARRRSISQWERHVEPSLATVQPQFDDIVAIRNVFLKQILGLNPFKTSYFAQESSSLWVSCLQWPLEFLYP
jgi:ATP-binding cassette subfamily B (MDR/TAP) protein 1